MTTGERLPMLLGDNEIPDFWATLFVCTHLRSQAQTTIEHALNVLRHLRNWENYHERDLSLEFRVGRFLTDGDLQSLADLCAYEVKAFKKWADREKCNANFKRVVSVTNLLALKIPSPLKTVQFDSQYNRLTTVASYLKFIAETVCRVRADKRESQTQIKRMCEELLRKRPKSNASKSRGRYAQIPAASYRRFMDIASTNHSDNPFRAGEARSRNYLMIRIADELGLRAGEILGLWVEDITYGNKPTLSVVRRHNNPLDPRKKQSVPKTLERTLPLSQELAAALNTYIINERSKHFGAKNHSILFVASQNPWKGHPLSYNSLADAIKSISLVDPDLLADITPHALRHDRACRFIDELEAINHAANTNNKIKRITDGEIERSIMDFFGWANPKSAAIYLKRRTRERVDTAMREFQGDTFSSGDKGNK
jgi:integrase